MSQVSFDTLEYAKRLEGKGMPREQAEEFASLQKLSLEEYAKEHELVTKNDIFLIQKEIRELEIRLNRHIFNMLLGFAAAIGAFFGIALSFLK